MPIKKKPADASEWKTEQVPDEVIDPDDAEIDIIFADFPQNDTCIELFRVNAQGGRPMFLEQVTPAMFSFGYVCEKFGGGKYFARGKYKGGARQPVRLPFEIEGDPFPVKRTMPAYDPLNAERMNPVQRVFVGEPDEPTDNMSAMLAMMKLMMSRMEGNEETVLRRMQMYKELLGGKEQAPLETAISMFTKGLELAGNSSLGESNPWLMIAREFKEPLGKIVDTVQIAMMKSQAITATAQPMHTHQPSPVTMGAAQPVQQPPAQSIMEATIEQGLRFMMPMLVTGAAKNADPGMYADLILDQMPGSAYNPLREWLLKPEYLDELCKFEPGIRFQQEWWAALRGELISTLTEQINGHSATQSEGAELTS